LQWQELFREPNDLLFRDREELARIYASRAQPGDTVVTYCFVGYRASMTYLVARYLGYQAKLYDGSYEDWSRRRYPLVSGAKP
jgi:thiosulfate/3-mercaptopyruvate sulfurtransferase